MIPVPKPNYSIAVDSGGHLWACQPDSPDDVRVRREADEILTEGGRELDYTVHRGLTLTDVAKGETVFSASPDNGLVDNDGFAWAFAVR